MLGGAFLGTGRCTPGGSQPCPLIWEVWECSRPSAQPRPPTGAPATYWAAWMDALPVMRARRPAFADSCLQALEGNGVLAPGLQEAADARQLMQNNGWRDCPSWRKACDGEVGTDGSGRRKHATYPELRRTGPQRLLVLQIGELRQLLEQLLFLAQARFGPCLDGFQVPDGRTQVSFQNIFYYR